jgi:hypothetical protein
MLYRKSSGMPLHEELHLSQFLHHPEDQVFVVDLMVIDSTQETVVSNAIS